MEVILVANTIGVAAGWVAVYWSITRKLQHLSHLAAEMNGKAPGVA